MSLAERRLPASLNRSTEKNTRFRWVLAIRGSRMGTGDGRFAMRFERSGVFVSVAMFGGSLAPSSIRVGDGQDSGDQSWLHDARSAAAFHLSKLGARRLLSAGL
ncbi:MAG: hypothetical protein CME06_04195 [Gemmatimonadetes bacterium]|nr:hypothetical protein [Gemmatimonadota bacterium]